MRNMGNIPESKKSNKMKYTILAVVALVGTFIFGLPAVIVGFIVGGMFLFALKAFQNR